MTLASSRKSLRSPGSVSTSGLSCLTATDMPRSLRLHAGAASSAASLPLPTIGLGQQYFATATGVPGVGLGSCEGLLPQKRAAPCQEVATNWQGMDAACHWPLLPAPAPGHNAAVRREASGGIRGHSSPTTHPPTPTPPHSLGPVHGGVRALAQQLFELQRIGVHKQLAQQLLRRQGAGPLSQLCLNRATHAAQGARAAAGPPLQLCLNRATGVQRARAAAAGEQLQPACLALLPCNAAAPVQKPCSRQGPFYLPLNHVRG